jgi:hypothetical protein
MSPLTRKSRTVHVSLTRAQLVATPRMAVAAIDLKRHETFWILCVMPAYRAIAILCWSVSFGASFVSERASSSVAKSTLAGRPSKNAALPSADQSNAAIPLFYRHVWFAVGCGCCAVILCLCPSCGVRLALLLWPWPTPAAHLFQNTATIIVVACTLTPKTLCPRVHASAKRTSSAPLLSPPAPASRAPCQSVMLDPPYQSRSTCTSRPRSLSRPLIDLVLTC